MLVGIHRHPAIASTTAIYVLALAGYGLAADSPLAVPYLVQMVALSWLVLALDKRSPFSTVTLTGLSLWGLMPWWGAWCRSTAPPCTRHGSCRSCVGISWCT